MRLKPRIILGGLDRNDRLFHWSHLGRSSTAVLLAVSVALWILTYQYCRLAYFRDPTSYFFDRNRGYERRYSGHREQQAYDFIHAANGSAGTPYQSQADLFMCIGIATVARPSEQQYVTGTIGSLLEGLSDEERKSIYLMPLIAHTNSSDHPIRREPWLTNVANHILEYDPSAEDLAMLKLFETGHHYRNKSMYDYSYLLRKCQETGAAWTAMVEDDVLARAGWFSEAKKALRDISDKARNDRWLYLRMFYTENLLGWNSEEWPRYLGWSLATFLGLSFGLVGIRNRSSKFQRHLSNLNVAVICLFSLPMFIILYFMAGRVSMQPLSFGVHEMNRFGCCSQGFVFPRVMVPSVIERTKKAMDEDYYADMLLERWADVEELKRFVLVPSLLQHVGAKSSKGWGYDENAGTTWNFKFEDQVAST
ncbi:MAG: hypothetical protein Q9220_005520 [cf. Caloplaca sp. 1 TL-2023]